MSDVVGQQGTVGGPMTMEDGTTAYLSASKSYYIRREPDLYRWTTVKYYTLKGVHIPLAKARCKLCKDVIESQYCGNYVSCKCTKSYADTDRWTPERHRYGGQAEPLKGNVTKGFVQKEHGHAHCIRCSRVAKYVFRICDMGNGTSNTIYVCSWHVKQETEELNFTFDSSPSVDVPF